MSTNDRYYPYATDAEETLSDAEILVLRRNYEREGVHPRVQTKFNYAWGLTKSTRKQQQQLGIRMMHEIYDEYAERRRECMYYLAIGYYKLGEYGNARVYIERLLALEPNNAQARSMRELIEEKVTRDGMIGLALSGGAIALVGIAAAAIFSRKSK
ncbi:mitochondrial membrane protein [Coemansia spiralis]|uniref:Mitochondrial fission 1 protein n=2 Tax=Coemansia TaxID=4863 RepID=A0A9W8G4K3_9FUNG|nr:hypothetical protein BX070DRAFT_189291 [Coemansia spiralis]KAJ1996250.1 mitochondrial membrane protein [Coemansia umbellata]KAJ2625993.1 mitochondrial membrane protein [Coemansia sp. RSA 1358]KAJ2678652.1 mitochondrial membrane protein [Coemansia spiralis]